MHSIQIHAARKYLYHRRKRLRPKINHNDGSSDFDESSQEITVCKTIVMISNCCFAEEGLHNCLEMLGVCSGRLVFLVMQLSIHAVQEDGAVADHGTRGFNTSVHYLLTLSQENNDEQLPRIFGTLL